MSLHCELEEFEVGRLVRLAHEATFFVTSHLGVSMDRVSGLQVRVEAGGRSSARDEAIVVSLPKDRGTLSNEAWFELLYSHELTHVVVQTQWGRPPVLWWEGLPVALGDDRVRTRVSGRSYHQHCRALDLHDRLLPMRPLLSAAAYYGRRPDYRVDLQAGSLCGYLLSTHGAANLRTFVEQAESPTPEDPRLRIEAALRQNFGTDFDGLIEQWRHWLRQSAPPDDDLLEQVQSRTFGDMPPARAHCEFCYAPIDADWCSACGAPPPAELEVC